MSTKGVNKGRRQFLTVATSVVGAAGVVGVAVPFLSSWNPSAKAKAAMLRVFADHLLAMHLRGELTVEAAAAGKLLGAEMQNELYDDFLQLHGGYGYMADFDIGRAWADARVGRIYGGSSEVMTEIIARTL